MTSKGASCLYQGNLQPGPPHRLVVGWDGRGGIVLAPGPVTGVEEYTLGLGCVGCDGWGGEGVGMGDNTKNNKQTEMSVRKGERGVRLEQTEVMGSRLLGGSVCKQRDVCMGSGDREAY